MPRAQVSAQPCKNKLLQTSRPSEVPGSVPRLWSIFEEVLKEILRFFEKVTYLAIFRSDYAPRPNKRLSKKVLFLRKHPVRLIDQLRYASNRIFLLYEKKNNNNKIKQTTTNECMQV